MRKLNFALSVLVLPFAFYSVQAQAAETKTGTATVSGRVTLKGEPARGVMVVLVTQGRSAADAPRARADESGRFNFTGVPAGRYSVTAAAPGYVSPDDTNFGMRGKTINIADGEKIENLDIEIKRGGANVTITMIKGCAITGRVTNAMGEALIGVQVNAAMTRDVEGNPIRVGGNRPRFTDDRGVYRIYGLQPGTYVVFTRNNAYSPFPSPYDRYEVMARRSGANNEESFASAPRRIVVKGADVGGIELKLLPLGSISGKFALETAPATCESNRKFSLEEALLNLRYETKPSGSAPARSLSITNGLTEKGEFTVYNLEANKYFIEPRLPNENWYVKSITATAASTPVSARGAAARPADAARNGIALKAGEKISGVTATIADGAGAVSGKVTPAKATAAERSRLPSRLRVHLVPAEAAAANDVLRYAETFARSDGSFSLGNIAPGKYWLVARAAPDEEPIDGPPAPVAWNAIERAKLRKEAESIKTEVELKPCQRIVDQVVRPYGR
jgi:hypothetical protein